MKNTEEKKINWEEVGKRLSDLRTSNKISQEKLANEFGCKRSTIINYEKGRAVPPTLILDQYIRKFRTSADYILYEEDCRNGTKALLEEIVRLEKCVQTLEKIAEKLLQNVS